VPLWIPYLFIPVGFALFLLQLMGDLWMNLSGAPLDEKGMTDASPTLMKRDV
jgi:TRAP-type C4-dicarboxylate transport system permease small subunit